MEDDRSSAVKIARMKELMAPIDQQLMMCDDERDQIMMACAMLVHCRDLLDQHIGEDGRKTIFQGFIK